MNCINVDGVEYVKKEKSEDIRIVVLQRGWVMVGRFSQDGEKCVLTNAYNVRRWGTSKGLGELAEEGPLTDTKLDKCPDVRFHELTVVLTVDCEVKKWSQKLT